jgi:hypothetical protein
LVKNHLGQEPTGVAAAEMRWAVLLINDSGKQIVSMTTAWTVDQGEPSSIYAGSYPFRRGRFIEPGSTTLVLPQFVFGAGAYVPTAEEAGLGLPEFERHMSAASEISIWIDGVIFDDGAFYGLDETQMFTRMTTAVDTYKRLFDALRGKSEDEALQIVLSLEHRFPEDAPFKLSYGDSRPRVDAVAAIKCGHLARFLETKPAVVASVPEIHRGK